MPHKGLLAFALMVVIIAACSIVKKEDPVQNVRAFLTSFHGNLDKSDQEILKPFRVRQSPEAVLAVIRILQNKEKYFLCTARFSEARIFIAGSDVQVIIPGVFTTIGLEHQSTETASLELWLKPEGNSYVITKLEGEDFYNTFTRLKNANEWGVQGRTAIESRLPIYAQAQELENKFDTVIYYATYKNENYFYVVDGEWSNYFLEYSTRNQKNDSIKMGLANSAGEVIIPIEYDLIGTIAFDKPDVVEVKKDGKFGYFDLQSKTFVVEPKYDMIVPASFNNTFAIVRQDSVVGWLNNYHEFQEGFPSTDVQNWFERFTYLHKNLRLAAGNQVFCEIPSQDHVGNGILMPPSYLVKHGVFEEIEHGIVTTQAPVHGYTEYKETKGSWLQRITDTFSALTTSIQERYLEGREEFYNSSTIVFIDNNYDTVGIAQVSGTEISMRVIDSTLLEIKTPHDWWFLEEGVCLEANLYRHAYFATADSSSIKQLKSNRSFPETQFVKLDSSYITGQFLVYNRELQRQDTTTVLSSYTLNYMRDEILASYGYSFPGTEISERFSSDWYTPVHDEIGEIRELLSDVDRHNVDFLDMVITAMHPEPILPEVDESI